MSPDTGGFAGLLYPEAPRWVGSTLWVSDVHAFRLKGFDLDGRQVADIAVPERPSGLGVLPDGTLLMATGIGRTLQRVANGRSMHVADLRGHAQGLLNDMVVDAQGRAYIGDTGYDLGAGEPSRPGRLLLYSGGEIVVAADDLTFPNGMALTSDGRRLYLAETFASRICAFDVASDGSLGNRRIHAIVDGTPDGICLDAEGALWVATLARSQFQRINAVGEIVDRIDVNPRQAIACMLGGPDRKTLFLCAALVDRAADGNVLRTGSIMPRKVAIAGIGLP